MSSGNGTSRRQPGSFFCVDRSAWQRLHEAKCATLKVYVLLASREMESSGTSKQSIEFIGKTLGIARSSVFRALDELREMGLLEVDSGMGRWNQSTYRLRHIPLSQEVAPMTPLPVEGSHQCDPIGPTHGIQKVPPMTPPHEKSNEKSNEKKEAAKDQQRPFDNDAEAIQSAWNVVAKPLELGTVRMMSPARIQALQNRLADPFFRKHWEEALEMLPTQRFALGHGASKWKLDFDRFLDPKIFLRLIEGKYETVRTSGTDPNNTFNKGYPKHDPQASQRDPNHGKF